MLIGYTNEMSNHDLADLADWADYHAKEVPNPTWKRAYALIREGADLLLRRRANHKEEEPKPCKLANTDCGIIPAHVPHVDLCGTPCTGHGRKGMNLLELKTYLDPL